MNILQILDVSQNTCIWTSKCIDDGSKPFTENMNPWSWYADTVVPTKYTESIASATNTIEITENDVNLLYSMGASIPKNTFGLVGTWKLMDMEEKNTAYKFNFFDDTFLSILTSAQFGIGRKNMYQSGWYVLEVDKNRTMEMVKELPPPPKQELQQMVQRNNETGSNEFTLTTAQAEKFGSPFIAGQYTLIINNGLPIQKEWIFVSTDTAQKLKDTLGMSVKEGYYLKPTTTTNSTNNTTSNTKWYQNKWVVVGGCAAVVALSHWIQTSTSTLSGILSGHSKKKNNGNDKAKAKKTKNKQSKKANADLK